MTFKPGELLRGCEVASRTSSKEVVLRCPCGQTFPVSMRTATEGRIALRCPECTGPGVNRLPMSKGEHKPIRDTPRPGTKTHTLYRMILTGQHYYDAASDLGLAASTGEKCYFRFVLPMRQRERIAELEKELADLKGTGPCQ